VTVQRSTLCVTAANVLAEQLGVVSIIHTIAKEFCSHVMQLSVAHGCQCLHTHHRWRDAARSEGVARARADADARLKAVTAEIVSRYEARLSALTADVAAAQVY
jgi:hypothetical protein